MGDENQGQDVEEDTPPKSFENFDRVPSDLQKTVEDPGQPARLCRREGEGRYGKDRRKQEEQGVGEQNQLDKEVSSGEGELQTIQNVSQEPQGREEACEVDQLDPLEGGEK